MPKYSANFKWNIVADNCVEGVSGDCFVDVDGVLEAVVVTIQISDSGYIVNILNDYTGDKFKRFKYLSTHDKFEQAIALANKHVVINYDKKG